MPARARFLSWVLLLFLVIFANACAGGSKASAPEAMAGAAAPPGQAMADQAKEAGGEKKDQATTWKRSQLSAHRIRVSIGDREELPVRSMQAKVTVDGFMARVVLDVQVKNDRGGTYEGTFQLRLPEGASPYFFAFGESTLKIAGDGAPPAFDAAQVRTMGTEPADIMTSRASSWSGPKEARIVPKEKAVLAYNATVRRAVDPALLEWAGPSIFSARVYPLTAGATHRIVVGYDVPLTHIGDDLQYDFDLPEKVGSKTVDIAVAAASGTAAEITPQATPAKDGGKEHYRFEEPADKTITVRLKKPGRVFLSGTDARTGPSFALDLVPDLGASQPAAKGEDAALFLVDTSLSSNPDRFNVWLKLLSAVLENNRDSIKRFNVQFFNIEQAYFKDTFVDNDPKNVADLLAFAGALTLEGATDVAAALRSAAKAPGAGKVGAPARWDVFLLSDGSSTWGETDLFALTRSLAQSPVGGVYAYQTGMSGTDTDALSLLARETGGAMFSVTGDAEVKAASTAHRARPWKLTGMKLAGTSDLLLKGRPRFLFPGQSLSLVGRGTPDKGAQLELSLEQGGQSRTVRVPVGQALASPLAVRAYGQVAVGQIEELLPVTEPFARAFAVQFRVTGKTCSLVMLESEADYQRFGIRPEDEALVVKQSEAGAVVQKALDQLAGSLGNPKAGFLRWLETLPRQPGMTLEIPTSLKLALEQMPEQSFRVEAQPLATKQRDRAPLPAPIVQALATHKVEYDPFTAEAERRRAAHGNADALKALSSLVEENPGDTVLTRDVGISAMTWGLAADAYHLFRRVAAARPYEPQTYRAMAQALVRLGQIDLAIAYFEIGLAGRWDGRFGEFRKILAVEYLELLRRVANGEVKTSVPDFAKDRLSSVANEVQIGRAALVVMITWNTDATDVDLHVIEPSGEECFYGHPETASGGRITQDVTQGYGPEMYVLKATPSGSYVIRAKYFASDSNRASARTKVQALVIEDYGTGKQRMTERMVTLEYGKQMHEIARIERRAGAQVASP
jgi:hypothetical protein